MDAVRLRYAAKRGVWVAGGVFAIAYGLAMLRPSEPPFWLGLVVAPLAFGALYGSLVYAEIGPLRIAE